MTSSVSEDRFTAFDNHGRLLASQQVTDGQTYTFGYQYNLSGGLVQETYPSGRVVRNYLDSDGGLSEVTTKPTGGLNTIVASNFDYSATGAVRKMQLGNGLWETAQFDQRHQLTQIGLGTSQTNNDLFKVDYEYGELQTNGTVDAAKNIGNIARTTTTIPTTSFVQTFKYDAINRLTEAIEKTGSTQNWKQTFGYDRFGNRSSFYQIVGSTELPTNAVTKPTIDQANNRFTTGQGYTYDYNGNIVQDAEGRSFTFNGDDKQIEVRNTSTNVAIGQYYYDGSGARVKKVVPGTGEVTIFVYDAGGALAAEYSTVEPPDEPTTSYLTTDHLGSPRVITDSDGEPLARRDFMPFGEDLGAGVGPRTENMKYSVVGADHIRKRFTGYEKDDETGLDFAEARMYQNKHGRFTAPDPLLASSSAFDPQSFNRYTYTGNNPVHFTDPSGLKWCRNSSSTRTYWTENDGACDSGDDDVGNSVGTVTAGNCTTYSTNGPCGPGSIVYLNPNGTVQVQNPSPEITALAQGQSVNETVEVTGGASAEEIVTGGGLSPSGQVAPRDAIPLTCSECGGSEPLYTPPLDTSKNEGLKSVEGIARIAEHGSLLPGIGPAFAMIAVVTRAGQGDLGGAGGNMLAGIPGVAWLKKGDKAAVVAKEVAVYSDDLVKAAQQLYPKLAGKIQLHHITPKYLGGAKNGALAPLDAAYHQQITNAFRNAWGYGKGQVPNAAELRKIMDAVYKQFPLPPG